MDDGGDDHDNADTVPTDEQGAKKKKKKKKSKKRKLPNKSIYVKGAPCVCVPSSPCAHSCWHGVQGCPRTRQ